MRITSIFISLTLLLLAGSVSVHAHAMLDRADPRVGSTANAAPREVSLSFTQDLEPAFSTIEVTGPSGQRVDEGKPRIDGKVMRVPVRADQPGVYRVKWHVLSVDTHTTEGGFSFKVGQ
jgi:methionine-rich copper-binding protein CopC